MVYLRITVYLLISAVFSTFQHGSRSPAVADNLALWYRVRRAVYL